MDYDKSLTYNSETQTLIGERKRMLMDMETGEVIPVDQITKRVYGTRQFWKVYLMDFLMVLGIIDSRQLDVFIFIVENTQPSTNLFIGTYDAIGKATGVSRQTIAKIMKKLQSNNFVRKQQNGVYAVNPNILMKGNDKKRQILLSYYDSEAPSTIEVTRGPRPAIPTTTTPTTDFSIDDSQLPGQLSIEDFSTKGENENGK